MANTLTVKFTSDQQTGDLTMAPNDNPQLFGHNLMNYVRGVISGGNSASILVEVRSENSASGTATCSGVVATNSVTVNGVVFAAVASGATGNQFVVGGSNGATATNLAAKINASTSTSISGVVRASVLSNVVTITAVSGGVAGNSITLASTAHITLSGAALTGGDTTTLINSATYAVNR